MVAKLKPAPLAAPYAEDFAAWAEAQARLVRAGRLSELDRQNVAEELDGLARRDRREIESRLEVLLMHLLKWQHQPERRSNSWRGTIRVQRHRIARLIAESPSLAHHPGVALDDAYLAARPRAAEEMGVEFEALPDEPPFAIADVLDPEFWPESPASTDA